MLYMSRWSCLYFGQLINECLYVCLCLSENRTDTCELHAFDLIITITDTCPWKQTADMTLGDTGKESTE